MLLTTVISRIGKILSLSGQILHKKTSHYYLTVAYVTPNSTTILGPPIRGECGASYRYSENLAIDTGMKPFVVEIKIHGGYGQVCFSSTKESSNSNRKLNICLR